MPDDLAPPAPRSRWRPDPLTWAVIGMLVWNAVVLWFAFHGTFEREVGNDPAGEGMARGFRELFALAAATGVGVLTLLYLVIRQGGVRVALVMLLLFASLSTPLLLG